ncbi:translation initiation factor [Cenarchaeum symbiosum A]|uniref:Translation initiation factor 6 n=1 Tax=Cenarchaeum symbiosum (strain A) TaxID=414004 RepID=IF6_CENSY|nr:RecName: Full=Translation initiation factor 6; Short=aIF-6 [Cenarchaeum symbiosum A]ABK78340.1 translation initiation factor [Cenarchaeum symbiosum A]
MDIFKYDVYRGPNIGIYTSANDEKIFLPRGFAKAKAARLEGYLGAEALYTSVANTRLMGTLMVLNNSGIIMPSTISEIEYEFYKKHTDLNVVVLDTKFTALGNMISVNDRGGVVSPVFPREEVRIIADALGIEVIQRRIAGYNQVGAMMVATSGGGIIHPETDGEDVKRISEVMGVHMEPATINGGIPFVSSGLLANKKSVVAGSFTSGPEIMMLTRAFAG